MRVICFLFDCEKSADALVCLRSRDSSVVPRTWDIFYALAENLLHPPFVVETMAETITAGRLGETRRPIIVIRMNGDELSMCIDVNATV